MEIGTRSAFSIAVGCLLETIISMMQNAIKKNPLTAYTILLENMKLSDHYLL